MSYGFEVRNSNSQIVVDDKFPCCYLDQSSVVNGSKPYVKDIWFYSISQVGLMPFFNVPVGHWVAHATDGVGFAWVSSQPSLVVRQISPLPQINYVKDPYGVEVYDASGDPMFSSSRELIAIKGFTSDLVQNPAEGNFSVNTQWVCPLGSNSALIPTQNQGQSLILVKAIKRVTSSSFTTVNQSIIPINAQSVGSTWGKTSAIFA
mgnify:CR=1 FL=1|tara:strand:- start:90 stop:704 length:615 start_codon:yes stop_codon:yes gene_type:complete